MIRALALSAAILAGTAGAAGPARFAGRWQYLQPPDTEGEVLDLTFKDGHLRGTMNGLERAGEHGLFYYVAEVSDLEIDPAGTIRFTVGERSFFRVRPTLSVTGGEGESGFAREPMAFEGKFEGRDLVLQCRDSGGSCPDKTMRFERLEERRRSSPTRP